MGQGRENTADRRSREHKGRGQGGIGAGGSERDLVSCSTCHDKHYEVSLKKWVENRL